MTYYEISTMIKGIGLPYAYYQFPDTGQTPPFICYFYPNNNDFIADNENYVKVELLTLELYTDTKDFSLEARVEAALKEAGLVFSRDEEYIESERMHLTLYSMEVVING